MPRGIYKRIIGVNCGKQLYPQCGFQKGNTINMGKKSPNWKGDKAGRIAMHNWVYTHKGKPKVCKHCGKRASDWANKDHKYKRKLGDYMSLCQSCHLKWDYKYNKRNKRSVINN